MMDFLQDKDFIELEKEYGFLKRARDTIESKHGELGKLSYVIVDLETTGLDPVTDEIIEIGALKVVNGAIKDVFNRLIKPERPLPPNITGITGITPDMLESELPIKPVLSKFIDFAGDNILVAHNADFDTAFLRNNAKKWLGMGLNNLVVCTLLISRDILPNLNNHKLDTVAKYFQIDISNRHRAIGDVELTYQAWLKFMDKLKDKGILTRKDLETYVSTLSSQAGSKAPL